MNILVGTFPRNKDLVSIIIKYAMSRTSVISASSPPSIDIVNFFHFRKDLKSGRHLSSCSDRYKMYPSRDFY